MTTEGVIKFGLRHRRTDNRFGPATLRALRELNGWRHRLWQLGFIGQDPARYGGAGFGNVSVRLGSGPAFVITATQTGGKAHLSNDDYVEVSAWDIARNQVTSFGPSLPSSESLTHAAIYEAAASVVFVFHVHAPQLWRARARLDLFETPAVDYGTIEMARSLNGFARNPSARGRLIAMPGHEDGIICFAATSDDAGGALIRAHARAG